MSQPSGEAIYIPPYSGVQLIECRDHLRLAPVPAVHEFFGYGKIKSSEATFTKEDGTTEPVWDHLDPNEEVWRIVHWLRFQDGHEENGDYCYLLSSYTEEQVLEKMAQMREFREMSPQKAEMYLKLYHASEEDHQFVEDTFPNYQLPPTDSNAVEQKDLYEARLTALAGLHPKTVALIKIANETKDPLKRRIVEKYAVQSYFAELAHYWTEDEIKAWQKTNPLETRGMCEFAEVMGKPRKSIDPVNHELALNWIRRHYNEMTEKALARTFWQNFFWWVTPGAIKKRRERLGLTTKRPPGPPPKS